MKSIFLAASLFLASLFGAQHATIAHPTSPPIAAAVELADNQPSASQELAVTTSGAAASSSAASTNQSSSDTTNSGFVKSSEINQNNSVDTSSTDPNNTGFVTQDQLASEINNLRALIYQLAASSTTAFTDPQIAANGNGVYYGGVAAPAPSASSIIATLTASEIPALNYFPATSTISIAFGGTGTSTVPNPNEVMLSDANGNWEYVATSSLGISGGGGSLTGSTGQVAYFSGTNTAVGTSSLFITPSGNVDFGTTTQAADNPLLYLVNPNTSNTPQYRDSFQPCSIPVYVLTFKYILLFSGHQLV